MTSTRVSKIMILTFLFIGVYACQDDPIIDDMTDILVEYDPSPYFLNAAPLPPPEIPADNQLTIQGVQLGRMLFHDPLLSKGEAQSCASCHVQGDGFSDINQFSTGVDGLEGGRQAMSIFNLGINPNGFFWDGRAETLREQALMPIQDPLEMHESLENVVSKLELEQDYKDQFMLRFDRNKAALYRFDENLTNITAVDDQQVRHHMLQELKAYIQYTNNGLKLNNIYDL